MQTAVNRVSACRYMGVGLQIHGGCQGRGKGRSWKTWCEYMRQDMNLLGLKLEWTGNKTVWVDCEGI